MKPSPRKGPSRPRNDERAAQIARTTGVPLAIAQQVAAGRIDLNEALKRMAFQDQVAGLVQRHGLNRALATQVALGQADLAAFLSRQRVEAHLKQNAGRTVFQEFAGREVQLGLHGRRLVKGRIVSVAQYDFVFADAEAGGEVTLHKLQAKFACDPEQFKKVRKALSWDKERREREGVEPRPKPQDRFPCSDKRLGAAWDAKKVITLVTLEGECFTGEIAWIGRYEVAMRTRQGVEVIVFRHAIDDLREG